jgi:sRNA-binding carbon storage regulator CsrA
VALATFTLRPEGFLLSCKDAYMLVLSPRIDEWLVFENTTDGSIIELKKADPPNHQGVAINAPKHIKVYRRKITAPQGRQGPR